MNPEVWSMVFVWILMWGCSADSEERYERLEGTYEVSEVSTVNGTIPGESALRQRYPGCTWGRMVWRIISGEIMAEVAVVCPSRNEAESMVCEARVTAPAVFDDQTGIWSVPHGARSSTTIEGGESKKDALGEIHCEAEILPGSYEFIRATRRKTWDAELKLPSGVVFRLANADLDTDYSAIFKRLEAAAVAMGGQ